MSITIDLPAEVEADVRALAEQKGESVEAFAREAVLDKLPTDRPPGEPEWLTRLAAQKPHAREALQLLVGIYDGPETDEELLAQLKALD